MHHCYLSTLVLSECIDSFRVIERWFISYFRFPVLYYLLHYCQSPKEWQLHNQKSARFPCSYIGPSPVTHLFRSAKIIFCWTASAGRTPHFSPIESKRMPLSNPISLLFSARWRAATWSVLPWRKRTVSKYGRSTLRWWTARNLRRSWLRRWGKWVDVWSKQRQVSFQAVETLQRRKTLNFRDNQLKKKCSSQLSSAATNPAAGQNIQEGPKTPTPLLKSDTLLDLFPICHSMS